MRHRRRRVTALHPIEVSELMEELASHLEDLAARLREIRDDVDEGLHNQYNLKALESEATKYYRAIGEANSRFTFL